MLGCTHVLRVACASSLDCARLRATGWVGGVGGVPTVAATLQCPVNADAFHLTRQADFSCRL
eukprot:351297-Chlamydomonas_euryale.AAC.11